MPSPKALGEGNEMESNEEAPNVLTFGASCVLFLSPRPAARAVGSSQMRQNLLAEKLEALHRLGAARTERDPAPNDEVVGA